MSDGRQLAVVIQRAGDIERVLEGSRFCDVGSSASIKIIAVSATGWFPEVFAPLSGQVLPWVVKQIAVEDAARVARDALAALPADVAASHAAYDGWLARSFLRALRQGGFDQALFAAWPPWPDRVSVLRAVRAGGAAVMSLTQANNESERITR
jgi:hypothetical protein